MKGTSAAFLGALLAWTVQVRAAAEVVEWSLAVVDNEAVTYSDWRNAWEQAVTAYTQLRLPLLDAPTPLRVLDRIVDDEILSLEAKRRQIDVSEEEINERIEQVKRMNNLTEEMFRRALKEQGLRPEDLRQRLRVQIRNEKLQQMEILPRVSRPKEEDLRRYYETNRHRMMTPERRRVAHILFRPLNPDATLAEQVRFKRNVEQAVRNATAGRDFAALARRHSQDETTRDKGGDLGWIEPGQMVPEFEEVVFRLKPGQVSRLFPTRFGLHIAKVLEVRPPAPIPFEEAKETIRNILLEETFRREFERWVRERKHTYAIRVMLRSGTVFVLEPDGWTDAAGRRIPEEELDGLLAKEFGVTPPTLPAPSAPAPARRGRR